MSAEFTTNPSTGRQTAKVRDAYNAALPISVKGGRVSLMGGGVFTVDGLDELIATLQEAQLIAAEQ